MRTRIDDAVRTADFLSFYISAVEETKGLMRKRELELMRQPPFTIETSRIEVIRKSALIGELPKALVAEAGSDVFEKEPTDPNIALFQMLDVMLSRESAALIKDSVTKLAAGAARNVIDHVEGRPPS